MSRPFMTGEKERITARRARVFELRAKGHSIRAIADIWNAENPDSTISKSQIHNDLKAELAELASQTYEKVVEVREMIAAKLDHMYSRQRFLAKIDSGDLGAYDRAIKMVQEYAKLYGAYAPSKIAQTDSAGNDLGNMTEEERAERIVELLEVARSRALAAEPENGTNEDPETDYPGIADAETPI